MIKKTDIDDALSAHGLWKSRLESAISTGKSEYDPKIVQKDDACPFGKWLYSLGPADAQGVDFEKVKALHAEFHQTAGKVLQLALSGRKDEAERELDPSGSYRKITGKLVLALQTWKEKI